MDTYQPIYDAVRSRLSNGDIGQAVETALRDANLGHYFQQTTTVISDEAHMVAEVQKSPSAIYRPVLTIDGNQWCALYGDDLQSGVAGFGDTPADAMREFDKAWTTSKVL